jgi:hypothetical protein
MNVLSSNAFQYFMAIDEVCLELGCANISYAKN